MTYSSTLVLMQSAIRNCSALLCGTLKISFTCKHVLRVVRVYFVSFCIVADLRCDDMHTPRY